MTTPRKPASFRIEQEPPQPAAAARPPRAIRPDADAQLVIDETDIFDLPDAVTAPPPIALPRRRSRFGAIFLGALGALVSLAVGLWVDGLVRELFARNDWLGWAALAAAALALLSLLVIVGREAVALRRLASVEHLRNRAESPALLADQSAAKSFVSDLSGFLSTQPATAAGRRQLAALDDDVIDPPDLLRLAEQELMAPLDARAQTLILDAAKRVSLVTAVSPRAFVDIAYVLFEASRMIRRLAELYGARPGTLGFVRLARSVLAHLAVTGTMAAGDSFVEQIVGQGLAARLSARLGEGVVNGMMTARIGLACMDVVRPLPFKALRRPGLGDFLTALARFNRTDADTGARDRT